MIEPASLMSFDESVLEADRSVLKKKFNEETARWISWMVHPYAISFAIVFFGYHILLQSPAVDDPAANAWRGLGFAVLVYLLICSWQLRDSLLVRPHPVFWRVVKGLAFLYLVSLVWLVFQSRGDARHLLSYWDPTLGVDLAEQSYAQACDVYTPDDPVSNFRNIYDAFSTRRVAGSSWTCSSSLTSWDGSARCS